MAISMALALVLALALAACAARDAAGAVTSVFSETTFDAVKDACDTATAIGDGVDVPTQGTAAADEIQTFSLTGATYTLPSQRCAACVACGTAKSAYRTLSQTTLKAVQVNPNALAARACLRVIGPVVGNLKLGASDDCVIFDDVSASFKGTLDTGLGNDCVIIGTSADNGAQFRGNIKTNEGNDAVFVRGAKVYGKIDTGMGADSIEVSSVVDASVARIALVDGGLWGGAGNDVITVSGVLVGSAADEYGAAAMVDVIVGREGDDLITVGHNAVVSNIDGGDGDDTLKITSGAMVESAEGEDGDDVIWAYPSAGGGVAVTGTFPAPTISIILGGSDDDCIGVRGFGLGQAASGSQMPMAVGKIDTGRGVDRIVADSNFRIDGPIEASQGSDLIILAGGLVNNDVRGGGGVETLRLVGASAAPLARTTIYPLAGETIINGDVSLLPDKTSHVFLQSANEASPVVWINGGLIAGTARNAAINSCTYVAGGDADAATADNSAFLIRDGVTGCTNPPLDWDIDI